jgi:hypothetical protein
LRNAARQGSSPTLQWFLCEVAPIQNKTVPQRGHCHWGCSIVISGHPFAIWSSRNCAVSTAPRPCPDRKTPSSRHLTRRAVASLACGDASADGSRDAERGPFWDQYSNRYGNPQRLRPPRWTSQRVNATEATTAMMSRMSVVTAVIYRARSKLVIGRVSGQTIDSGAGRVIKRVAVDIAVAIWRMLAGQR